jgi:PAS domain S-box-containing protein
MRSGTWRSRTAWTAGGIVLAATLFAVYREGRPLLIEDDPLPAEQFAVVALLAGVAALLAATGTRLHYRQTLHTLSERVDLLRQQSSPEALRSLPGEFQPLARQLETLCACYRQELADRTTQLEAFEALRREQQQTEATLQSLLGRADSEEGRSHSLIYRQAANPEPRSPASDMIARLSPELQWMAATPALQQFLGLGIAELNARSFFEIVHPEDAASLTQTFQQILVYGEGHNITFRIITRKGRERHLLMDALSRYNDDGTPLHLRCHFLDITDKVQTEEELRRRTDQLSQANDRLQRINRDLERLKESYRDLYHHAPVMYFSLDAQGKFAACNETMLRTLGYQPADLLDQPYVRLLPLPRRESFLQQPDAFHQAGEVETQWVKKDGQVIDVWIRTVPVTDSHGRFLRSRSAAQDVTERNRLANALRAQAEELQEANAQLRRINRELDDFTYVVSHDLKEPLRTVQVFGNFLAQDYGSQLGAEGQEYITHMVQASRRLGLLIDDLLNLSRAGRVINTPHTFDLAEIVPLVCADLASLIQRKGAVVRVEGQLPQVLGDPQRITQLLTNLVSNGLKYNNNPHPEVVIGATAMVRGAGQPPDTRPRSDSKRWAFEHGQIAIWVRDNGIGIEPQYHEQIFGIFRRLHLPEEYEGTGAGLAICKKIVEAHGGRIWVESEPGQGATFFFTVARAPTPGNGLPDGSGKETMILDRPLTVQ